MPPPANSTATKRIKKEIADLAKEKLGDIVLTPNESNIFVWKATIPGPQGSPYEGGVFDVDIRVPENYPFSPPSLQFMTRVYHCNINSNGGICLDLLKTAWSPALSLYKVILSLSSLLTDPNPADPLVPHIAQEFKRNKKKHDETAREWVKLYAKPKVAAPPPPPAPKQTPFEAAASRASTSRPRGPSRLNSSFSAASSATPPPVQLAGTRRTHTQANGSSSGMTTNRAIVLTDSDGSDIEVVSGRPGVAVGAGSRKNKRAKVDDGTSGPGAGRGGGDDVIVVDD